MSFSLNGMKKVRAYKGDTVRKYLVSFLLATVLTGCTYSITMVHTQGEATDVVDETASNTPSTSVSIPTPAL